MVRSHTQAFIVGGTCELPMELQAGQGVAASTDGFELPDCVRDDDQIRRGALWRPF